MSNCFRLLGVAVALAALSLVACSTATVSTDYQPGTDFSRYRTFGFVAQDDIQNRFVRDRLEKAITAQLEAKGMQRATSPDLLVALHGRMDSETVIDTSAFGYRSRWGWWGGAGARTTVRQVPIGTVVVDLVDAAQRELVWQGRLSDVVRRGGSPESRQETINEDIAKLFAEFPPRS